jgi:hypothetical protein
MFSTERQQRAADALEDARIEYAKAMAEPKNTVRLNAASHELTRLEDQLNALVAPAGPKAYGAGCSYNRCGYKDLSELDEDKVNNPTYIGSRNRQIMERTGGIGEPTNRSHQVESTQWATGHKRVSYDDQRPATDHSQGRMGRDLPRASDHSDGWPRRDYSGGRPVRNYNEE